MGREVGRIVEVKGVNVRAELYELLPPYIVMDGHAYTSPRINTYVKTKVGLDEIICQITGEYYSETYKGQFTGYYLELSVKGYFDGDVFVQGLRLLPMVASSIELLDADEFKRINDYSETETFHIGKDLFDFTQDYSLSYNAIIPSHIGVFGNTGSGKSNTLARLTYEYVKILKEHSGGKILVFDLNNEYGADSLCNKDEKIIYDLSTRADSGSKIPMDYSDLTEDEWCLLLNATEATQRPVIKTAYCDSKTQDDYKELICRMIRTGQHQLVKSMQYHVADYIVGIDKFVWHSSTECYYVEKVGGKVFSNVPEFDDELASIYVQIPDDKLKLFLFRLYFATAVHIGYGTQYEFISPLLRRAEKLIVDFKKVFIDSNESIFKDRQVAVVQLANVNRDMVELIPAILTNHLFFEQINLKQEGKIKSIVNIVIDEAHNLLYEESDNYRHTKSTIEAFERAIKEGRKFGLFLWIASQRPSDISQTIISQLHNYFIHKLVNPYDLNKIRKAVAFLDENAMNALTVLGPGECVVSGTGINMPCFIRIDQLDKIHRPSSDNIKLFGSDGIMENDDTDSELPD